MIFKKDTKTILEMNTPDCLKKKPWNIIGKQVISLLSESVWMASTKRASPGSRRSSGLALVNFGPAGSRAETWWKISGNQLHFSFGEFGGQQVIV